MPPSPGPEALFSPCSGNTAALISLVDPADVLQRHWWLAAGGSPQRIAGLLGAPLRRSGAPACTEAELLAVFSPLPALASADARPAGRSARFRYLLCLHGEGVRLSCWRQDPAAGGWRRQCGPMALPAFIRRFDAPRGASS